MKKRIIVTGAYGMIGKELVELLKKDKNNYVIQADLANGYDLKDFETCLELCNGADEVYHLAGIKGNPKKTSERPTDFMVPMLMFDTNMIHAAQLSEVKKFLYTSSIAVLNPKTDRYPAWAKMTAETLIDAMRIQFPKGTKYCIVRPANVYGRYDNFKNPDAMVVTSLINKSLHNDTIEVWGDGTQERDFINAKDVARGMILTMKKMPIVPINLCSGYGISINELLANIIKHYGVGTKLIFYKKNYNVGDKRRVMKPNGEIVGFKPTITIEKGVSEIFRELKK